MSAPRRKKRVQQLKESPFPLPIATVTQEAAGREQWFYYTGFYHGNHVTVQHSGDIHFLNKMGFFGKGMLSRSCPDFNQRKRTVHIPIRGEHSAKSHVLQTVQVTEPSSINKKQSCRLNWKISQDGGSSVVPLSQGPGDNASGGGGGGMQMWGPTLLKLKWYLLHKKWSESCDLNLANWEGEMDSSSSSYCDIQEELDDVFGSNESDEEKVEDSAVTCWDIPQNFQAQIDARETLQEQKTEKFSNELSWELQEKDHNLRTGTKAVTRNYAKDSWKDAKMDETFGDQN